MGTLSGLKEHNPYVGPRPLQQGEPIYGRDAEVEALYCELQARRIVVLHSPSGAGKSSLVQAGLIPRLEAGGFAVWRPIRVSLDLTTAQGVPKGTNRYVLSALSSLEEELPPNMQRSLAQLAELDFSTYVQTRPRRKKHVGRPVVLLFDQFEEVLTMAPHAVDAKRAFFSQMGRALDHDNTWALIIIREDYLAAFAPYRDRLPTHMTNRFRLDLLGIEGARKAALEPARAAGRSFPAVDSLVRDLSMTKVQQIDGTVVAQPGPYVEPVQLQVVCRRLWASMPADASRIEQAHIERYGSVTESLAAYYAQAVEESAGGDVARERAIRAWVGERLIVGGIRSLVRQGPERSGGLDNAWIEPLVDSYLVRIERRAGANWFELSHDRFVEPVLHDNEAWAREHLHPVQVHAKLWVDGRRAPALLLSRVALRDAKHWVAQHQEQLTDDEREFVRRSTAVREAERRERAAARAWQIAGISVLGLLVVGAVAAASVVLGNRSTMRAQTEELGAQKAKADEQHETIERKSRALTMELAKQQGLRASALAKAGDRAIEAVALAVEAAGRVAAETAEQPEAETMGRPQSEAAQRVEAEAGLSFEVFNGLIDALGQVQRGIALRGHTDRVMAVAYSPDGDRLATASKDGTVRVWDADSGAPVRTLEGHEGPVHAVAYSPDGEHLATASADKTVRVWAVESGREVTALRHAGPVQSVAISYDGTQGMQGTQNMQVASASGNDAWVWHLDGDAIVVPLIGHEGAVESVVFSPDGRRVATASRDKTARVWAAISGELLNTLEGHEDWVLDVAFSPDGTQLVTVGRDETVRTWNVGTGGTSEQVEQVASIAHGQVVQALAFSPTGTRLATATFDDDAGHLWDVATGQRLTSFRHQGPVTDVAFSPRGDQVATVSWDKTVRLWSTEPSPALTMLEGHADRVDAVAVSPDGRHIVTGGGAHIARVWDAKTGALRQGLRGHTLDVLAAAVSPDGARVVTGSWDATARVWDATAGGVGEAAEALFTLEGHTAPVVAVAFSPESTRIATASDDRTAQVWDAATGERLMVFEHDKPVRSVVFTPDGERLVVVVDSRPAKVWDVSTGQAVVAEFLPGFPSNEVVTAVAYSPDSRWFAAAYRDLSIRLWDRESKESHASPEYLEGHTASVVALGFSADGTQLASASEDGTARVWATGSSNAVASLRHEGVVTGVAFVGDGAGLVTASGDDVARVWSLDPEAWRAWGCAVLEGRAAYEEMRGATCDEAKVNVQAAAWPGSSVASGDDPAVGIDAAQTEPPAVIVVHGVELVLIPGGTFTMGSPSSERGRGGDEGPQHEVTLESFYLARTEVTNAQYALYVEANPGVPEPPSWAYENLNQPDQPIVALTWNEAKDYCDWAGLVLPTEAQWEYAARAGTDTAYWFGDKAEALERFGWFEDNSGNRAHSVGLKGASGYGLYDMHGNVWEWCLDAYGSYKTSVRAGDGLREQPDGVSLRVIRGGSFSNEAGNARSAIRGWVDPRYRLGSVGFRPAQAIP